MSTLQYRKVLDYVENTVLRPHLTGSPDYPDVDVSQSLDQPTMEMTPAVRVVLGDCSFEPYVITSQIAGANPDWAQMNLLLYCVAFSAESSQDASRQRDDLVERVENALREDPRLGGLAAYAFRRSIRMQNQPDESGLFAVAIMEVEVKRFV